MVDLVHFILSFIQFENVMIGSGMFNFGDLQSITGIEIGITVFMNDGCHKQSGYTCFRDLSIFTGMGAIYL